MPWRVPPVGASKPPQPPHPLPALTSLPFLPFFCETLFPVLAGPAAEAARASVYN